jgi:hypothetical protein
MDLNWLFEILRSGITLIRDKIALPIATTAGIPVDIALAGVTIILVYLLSKTKLLESLIAVMALVGLLIFLLLKMAGA